MRVEQFPKAMLGGFIGTLVMTLVWYPAASQTGAPLFDFAAVLGSHLTGREALPWTQTWWFGMAEHFFNGTFLFPMFYAFLLYNWLPGNSVLKGVTYGILLWAASQILIMPAAGLGIFSEKTPSPLLSLFISFNGHLVYGVLLGAVAGKRADQGMYVNVDEMNTEHREAA